MYTINNTQGLDPQLYAHQPFLTTNFAESDQETPSARRPLRQSKVRALGIMLLELELGATIESHRPVNFLNSQQRPNIYTDLSTAQLLVPQDSEKDKIFKARQTYNVLREIIRKCLYAPEFNTCRNDNHERSIVYREIPTPIQSALTIIGCYCEEIRFQPLDSRFLSTPARRAEAISENLAIPNTR